MVKTKNFIVDITHSDIAVPYSFGLLKKASAKTELDLEGIASLRKIFSKNRIKLLLTIKTRSPKSIYELSKFLERDVKAVRKDLKILEKFELIDYLSEKKGDSKRRLRPILSTNSINITVRI